MTLEGLDAWRCQQLRDVIRHVQSHSPFYSEKLRGFDSEEISGISGRTGYGHLRPLGRPLKAKVAGIMVVGRRYGHTSVYSQIVLNIMLNKMILAGSGFPALFMGMLGDAGKDVEAVKAMQQTLDRMVSIAYRLRMGQVVADTPELACRITH